MGKAKLHSARGLAVSTLEIIKNGAYSNLQLNAAIQHSKLEERDVHLFTTIVYGVIQHRLTLEYWLKPFVKQPQKMQPWVRELLYTALFQMKYLDKVPNHAIFDESIEIAKARGHEGQRRFVTGVLHQIDRDGVPDFNTIKDPTERLSIETSLPVWMLEELTKEVGLAKAESIARSINNAPAQSARVNRAVSDIENATDQLIADGFEVQQSPVAPDGLLLNGGFVAGSAAFANGTVTLQDESAMLVAPAMQITDPSMKVLDACAAPGGKTTQIATYLDHDLGGQVDAFDIHEHKVQLIRNNAERLFVRDRVFATAMDARLLGDKYENEVFDRALIDAPCSGFGLLRRKPEIRYEKTLQDSQNLQKIQLALLDSVAPLVKIGGLLTYSTCTILRLENDDVVNTFLAKHPEYELETTFTENNLKADRDTKTLTIYPDDFNSDGFFIASLKRVK
ncbi:16S rRNA (cytosine(967)-C(5))-methyltransferase RsmB [Periweissella cryptocerci]|uniref:16S rRNA (cytosine(967)-C(5))-methyltransferase n=1 Tax=Periweissella cryptocerci TaxID=2506420 RepID=A0A4V1AJ03_9LACO|nr:16S rRNA (cytosine(967)-C(5))-methyltransferase RsmB [Periweissella cryptocerci]QBO37305.1 16S rRNA (cytosine(967)-C(5))-methyltransferase RsmB [Periweissella cryptocerci]